MRKVAFLAVLAALLAGCGTPTPQVVQVTVEVTRLVEVTRIAEATRLVEVTPTPAAPVPVEPASVSGPLQIKAQLILFWLSQGEGQVNLRSTNGSGATISRLEYHCTVKSERTGEYLADQMVTAEAIPAGETSVTWFAFPARSEHTPGYFLAKCETAGVDPVSAQFYGPGNELSLPGVPVSNGTTACNEALANNSVTRIAYFDIKRRYEAGQVSYNDLASACGSALLTYYVAVNACR